MSVQHRVCRCTLGCYSKSMRFWVPVVALTCALLLPAADKPGAIKSRVKPGRAGVWIDGKYVGPASRFSVAEKYPVEAGDHEVTLRDPRYEDMTEKVSVKPGKTAVLKGKMKPVNLPPPPYGRLRFSRSEPESFMSVTAGDTAAVYLNDKFYGYVDELDWPKGGLLVPPGTYKLRVDSAINGRIERDITLEANKVVVIPLRNGEK